MYSVSVETTFSATHRVRFSDGTLEPLHGHDWVVRAGFSTSQLDGNGMVVDFVEAMRALKEAVSGFHHAFLNDLPVFEGREPTAEIVAETVFQRVSAAGLSTLYRVDVTEAPGCVAAYHLPVG